MPSGILAFTLGLEGGKFLSTASQAERSIGGLIGAAGRLTGIGALVGAAFESIKESANVVKGVFEAFERGAALQQLHARTGESVRDLFLLQRGFKAVGLEAEGVGSMLFHLQKGLTGVNELGENTAVDFAVMGLSMQAIRNMKAPEQFEAIGKALAGMDRASASAIAGKLFGREGAANFLQIARSGTQFAQAMKENAAAAAQMERNAAAFQQIEVSILKVKNQAQNLFAGIAEGAAPGVQAVLDMLNKIDLSALGKKFGDIIGGFTEAIKESRLGEVLSLTMEAGFQEFLNFAQAGMEGLAASLGRLFANMASTHYVGIAAYTAMAAQITALTGSGNAYDRMQKGLGHLINPTSGVAAAGAIAAQHALAHSTNDAAKRLAELLKSLADKLPKAIADTSTAPGTVSGLPAKPFSFTSIEKMGFHFGAGGPSILADHARTTAESTRKTAENTSFIANAMRNAPMWMQIAGGMESSQPTAAR